MVPFGLTKTWGDSNYFNLKSTLKKKWDFKSKGQVCLEMMADVMQIKYKVDGSNN